MNILILNWRDPKHPLSGGAEEVLYHYSQYWIKKGASVTWFSSSFKNAKESEALDGIQIIRRGSHFTVALWAFSYFLRGGFKSIDVVLDCFHFVPYFSKLYFWNRPVVALIHEVAGKIWFQNIFFPFALLGFFLEPLFLLLYRNNKIITGAASAKEDLKTHHIPEKNISIVHHGFTSPKKKKNYTKNNKPTFIFLGRLSKDKGIEDALIAFSYILKKRSDVTLWIVGKAESVNYHNELLLRVKKLNIGANCKFFGHVSFEQKYELLSKAWLLLHPSTGEGWGLNVIEANSVGTPAVGYNVAGLRDSIVHGKTGELVASSPVNLAEASIAIVEDKKLYNTYVVNAKKWSTTFSWDSAGRQSYEVIQKAYARS